MKSVTAKLKNAYRIGNVYSGNIYGDTRGRFPDGELVRTSAVQSVDGNIVTTANSVYEVDIFEDASKAKEVSR